MLMSTPPHQMIVLKISFDYINSTVEDLPTPERPCHTHVISEPIRPGRPPRRSVSGGVCGEAWVNRIGEQYYREEPTLAGRFRKSSMNKKCLS